MRRVFTVMGTLLSLFIAQTAIAAGKDQAANTTKALMQSKLASMHALLEGIINEDYKTIQTNADRLREISRATTWHKADSDQFLRHAASFQNAAEYLSEQSKNKNLEGVAMGYVRVNLECMQCHNNVRHGRMQK